MDKVIGYFVPNGKFVCGDCLLSKYGSLTTQSPDPCKVFLSNVSPYSQTCHECGKLCVDGVKKADGSPLILFDPPVPKTRVIFRKFDGELVAIFPDEPGTNDPSTCMSYSHDGQHGSCDPSYLMNATKQATSDEFETLKKELEGLGYHLEVIYTL